MWSKIKGWAIAFGTGLLAIITLGALRKTEEIELPPDPIQPLVEDKQDEIDKVNEQVKEVEKKLDGLRNDGVKDKSDEEIIDYWRKQ